MNRGPLPEPSELTDGFWAAARQSRLVIQRCEACGVLRHYPQQRCPRCLSAEWNWREIAGRGVIHSFTVTHQAFHPSWADRVPYVVATVELDESVRMVTDLDEPAESVAIGDPVEVFFDRIDDQHTLPRFRIRRPSQADSRDEPTA
ncbi:Zn-ribbon domain-containing OB-fold protein [Prescottella equi]|uniref:Zn-ribbon domain-containing OB-fold protein n=1 Tax=Rhodococcus hoagii TaxID=43767 RepID=UPI000D10EF85|nr:Zn-ribbon domain-containing OB-fold protein [Prescottella equi]AVP71409.1 hypothetical protein C7H75_25360 [Prescottella equi]MCD7052784.1 Zn-ribbon domain-containing OB-fold protein [Rhodococcus sp. BH2-1]